MSSLRMHGYENLRFLRGRDCLSGRTILRSRDGAVRYSGPARDARFVVSYKDDGGRTRTVMMEAADANEAMEKTYRLGAKWFSIRQAVPGRDESFEKLEGELAHKKGVKDPRALAAWIGREHGKIK